MNMMDIRRRMLESLAAGGVTFAYTGTFDSYGDASQGYLVLKTSGTLTIKGTVDLCLVGGGGRGSNGLSSNAGGGGGAGGFVQNYFARVLDNSFSVTIGAGSSTSGTAGVQTEVGTSYTASGGNSTTNGTGASGRGNGGNGANTSTPATKGEDGVFPWNDSTNFSSYQVSGCGGGGKGYKTTGSDYSGGLGGGGAGGYNAKGTAGTANTGGGGGGGSAKSTSPYYAGGNGGSGVVFICWGYSHS